MITSFIKHSKDEKSVKKEEGLYLIHLLQAFVNLTFSDEGIEPLLGVKAVSTFNTIISQRYVSQIMEKKEAEKIQELCLRALGNISINKAGKQECINDKVILSVSKYLTSESYDDRLNTSLVLMSCTIHLDGKKQAVQYEEQAGQPLII